MKVGYARVSTQDQNEQMQVDTLKQSGCDFHIYGVLGEFQSETFTKTFVFPIL